MKTLRALAALLSYPSTDLIEAADEIRQVIDGDTILPLAVRAELHRLIDDLAGRDLYDLQERYGLLFDRTRALSLHLFEHVHGESRERRPGAVKVDGARDARGVEQQRVGHGEDLRAAPAPCGRSTRSVAAPLEEAANAP